MNDFFKISCAKYMPDPFRRNSSNQLARKSDFKMPVSLLALAHF